MNSRRDRETNIPFTGASRNYGLTDNFGEMFERFAREFFSPQLDTDDYGFRPRVEIEETENEYFVSAELPGIRREDINLFLQDNSLIIEGRKERTSKEEQKSVFRSEFSYGSFHRSIPLRADVDDNEISASFSDGVLKVTLVKRGDGPNNTKRIPINWQQ